MSDFYLDIPIVDSCCSIVAIDHEDGDLVLRVLNKECGNLIRPTTLPGYVDFYTRRFIFHKPTTNEEMTAFLATLGISERTNIHRPLIERGWALNSNEADALLSECGWNKTLTSEDGWEPGE